MKKLCKFLLDLIYPNRCPCCNKVIQWDKLLCENCIEKLPKIDKPICIFCGKTNCKCDQNLQYKNCISITYYEGIVRDGIINFKVDNALNFAEYFAEKIADKIKQQDFFEKIDVVTCVPMSKRKKKTRGYNQAQMLGEKVAMKISKPFCDNILLKADEKVSQHSLSYKDRQSHAKVAFKASEQNISGKNILLCDDIITTGATLNECAKLLKKMGAENIFACTIATTNINC